MAEAPVQPEDPTRDGAAASGRDPVRPYDEAVRQRIRRERLPTLNRINARFAGGLKSGLAGYLRREVEVAAGPVEIQTYAEFAGRLAASSLNPLRAEPLRGQFVVAFDPGLVYLVVDNLFGSDGRFPAPAEARAFTPTEERIMQGLLGIVCTEWEQAWGAPAELRLTPAAKADAGLSAPSELMVATRYELRLGRATAAMEIGLTPTMLEPIGERFRHGDLAATNPGWAGILSQQLRGTELQLVAQLGEARLCLRELLQMQPGDVLPVAVPEFIQATVDGVAVLEGRYGTHGGHYAIQVERLHPRQPEAPPPLSPGAGNGR